MTRIISSLKKSTLLFVATFFCLLATAQDGAVDMADTMRSNGKIYVVVAVCLLILIGLFLYVLSVDRKVSKLEKDLKSNNY
jgi:cytochrome c biogenesis protein CcdA